MGFQTEFNWVLKLKPENGLNESELKEESIFSFTKKNYRTYPINIPIKVNKDIIRFMPCERIFGVTIG